MCLYSIATGILFCTLVPLWTKQHDFNISLQSAMLWTGNILLIFWNIETESFTANVRVYYAARGRRGGVTSIEASPLRKRTQVKTSRLVRNLCRQDCKTSISPGSKVLQTSTTVRKEVLICSTIVTSPVLEYLNELPRVVERWKGKNWPISTRP